MIDITCFNWVKMIQKSTLGKYEKYVAHYLSTYMNLNNDIAWPSQSRMYGEMSISQATLNRALNKLESEGWLTRERGNPTTNTRYLINIPTGAIQDIALGGTLSEKLGTPQERVGTPTERVGVLSDRDTNNNSNNKLITNNNKHKSSRCDSDSDFDNWWESYPKKTGKQKARIRFRNLSRSDREAMLADDLVKRYGHREKKYIKGADAYLNERRWEDDYDNHFDRSPGDDDYRGITL